MAPPTVLDRLRASVRRYFRDPQFSKSGLAKACHRNASWVSMLLSGERGVKLNELDPMAAYFRVSISELLGAATPGELSGDEQRLVYAFRVLPIPTQNHFLSILESMSVQAHAQDFTKNRADQTLVLGYNARQTRGVVPDAERGTLSPHDELVRLRAFLSDIALALGTAAAGEIPTRPVPGAPPDQTGRRSMANKLG